MAIEETADTTSRVFVGREGRTARRPLPPLLLALGLGLGLSSLIVYATDGYGKGMLGLWLGGVTVAAVFFHSISKPLPRPRRGDLVAPFGLAIALSPLYLAALYEWPVQVDSDELAVIQVATTYADAGDTDLFGVSTYLSRPALLFIAWGNLGQLFGGIDLSNMRLLHALCGLLVVIAAYPFFRQLLPVTWAAFAMCVLGASHSFFMISRLAMRENTAVLTEVVALVLLIWGLRYGHVLATFGGGVVAGLGFYVYFPGRATFPLWLMLLVALGLWYRSTFTPRTLLRAGAVATAGFVLMAAPIVIAESKLPEGASDPQRETLLIYPEGRELQRTWVFAGTEWEGFKKNVSHGLTTFNNDVVDHSWIYDNFGHGFVDPLTGILLWVGVGVVGLGVLRRRITPWALMPLGGFLVLWLAFAFVVNKAPNYTRLLIILPFVAYLVTEAVRFLAERTKPWVERWRPDRTVEAARAFVVVTLAALVVWNVAIAWDFVQEGREKGDPIGSTGRWIEANRAEPGQRFYLAADDAWKYYEWLQSDQRLRYFAEPGQIGGVISPTALGSFTAPPPFALFLRRDLLAQYQAPLSAKYPRARVHDIVPDGTLVVFEVEA